MRHARKPAFTDKFTVRFPAIGWHESLGIVSVSRIPIRLLSQPRAVMIHPQQAYRLDSGLNLVARRLNRQLGYPKRPNTSLVDERNVRDASS